ncbi:MAG TPA: type II 3-dehydroquinate dehydratase [Spirochaetota bacterium]|nr:type II 3-dehydroquinate dehydratase [Spirochaetota bacterium]HOL57926.1 type II 3-dehydroquinate dehydratase [Spirochaetota bacterium]HPP03670.1 type II 3-dehydroquinate dehydratase [Spirochaetota bacterium]
MKIGLLNGPNLNLLGKREPDIYGNFTLDDIYKRLKEIAGPNNEIVAFQSNIEGELINFIHLCEEKNIEWIIFNPGAYTHTSIAIRDAISATKVKVIEVHISNIHKREKFRHKSMIAPVCVGQISGFGKYSYEIALYYILNTNKN